MTFENIRNLIETTYNVIEYVEGHYKNVGKDVLKVIITISI